MKKYYYLIEVQYLGFRFHGWQKQVNLKTVHLMIDKTVQFVLQHENFKTLGTSRTDAMVSANHSAFELFTKEEIGLNDFFLMMNKNLPSDIKLLSIKEVDSSFNIINTPKTKEYLYLFSFGEKSHPFAASLVSLFIEDLDIELMRQGARLFEGEHNFRKYCTRPSEKTNFLREIEHCEIVENTFYTASFFPKKSYALQIRSKGFMRNQVRLIMGQLLQLGMGNLSIEELEESINKPDDKHLVYIAPSSGLILNKVDFAL